MRRIEKIRRIRNLGVFRAFDWPGDLLPFGRYNLIYGWNGSGKTTISGLFRELELRTGSVNPEVTLSIDGRDVSAEDLARTMIHARVFNRDFITGSVFPVDGGDVPPIFVVGKESVEKQKEVEQLKEKLATAEVSLESERSKNREAERVLDKHCIDRGAVIRDTLRSSGSSPYNNYDKASYRSRARKMVAAGDATTHRLSESDRDKLLAQHLATPKPKIDEILYEPPDLESQATAASSLLAEVVVAATIASLASDADLSSWVHEGLGLHKARQSDSCLFCEQAISRDRLAALEAHFGAEYEEFQGKLDVQIAELEVASKAAAMLSLPNRAEFYDDLAEEYEAKKSALDEARRTVTRFLESLADALKGKKARAFEHLSLSTAVPAVDLRTIDRLNEIIRKHNDACDSFQARSTDAKARLETDSVAAALDEFDVLVTAAQEAEASVERADTEMKRLKDEILRLEREIVEHRQPAEELNEDLQKYLGHDELRLEVKDTGYAIARNSTPVTVLSEGEMTAVALLYFLKSLRNV